MSYGLPQSERQNDELQHIDDVAKQCRASGCRRWHSTSALSV